MELGFCFEDSVFSESRDRRAESDAPYTARRCEPQWFSEEPGISDPTDVHTMLKFRADFSYRQKNFLKSLDEYSRCYELVPSTNNAMRRDVQESQARCLIHLGRYTEALEIAGTLMKGVNNTDHLTGVLNLNVIIHNHLGNLEDVVSCLQQLISLHPFNPHFWILLAECYKSMFLSTSSCTSHLPDGDQWGVGGSAGNMGAANIRACTVTQRHCNMSADCRQRKRLLVWLCACYIRARILLQFIQPQHASFVLDHNLKTQGHIEEQLNQSGLTEDYKSLITSVMSEDLTTERIHEDGQIDIKTTQALSSFVMPTAEEFKEKWFQKISALLLL
ncbi:uncharacterized protein C8orf76-like [Gastrophryne carolinensis]